MCFVIVTFLPNSVVSPNEMSILEVEDDALDRLIWVLLLVGRKVVLATVVSVGKRFVMLLVVARGLVSALLIVARVVA